MSVSPCGPPQQPSIPVFLNPLSSEKAFGSTAWVNQLLSWPQPQQAGQQSVPQSSSSDDAVAAARSVPQIASPPSELASRPPGHSAPPDATASSPQGFDGPVPLLSVFAGTAAASTQAAELPTADRLHELPELPSSLFPLSGTLQPLVSAFAAAAEADAFEPQGWPTTAETSLSAPAALTADNLEQSLPAIPLQHTCPCSTQVSLNPVIWRHFEPPYQLMVHAGLRTAIEETEVSLPLSIYSSLNPRVITTGKSTLPAV